ncbi:MAG: GDCCVxC domain-containing (seleno)protein [Candidatus Moranbacteria bacterium]|nr:GDCCVxC domain-containing (seleno)protein [Candidatus Moranbacteria bacterium]
MKLISKVTCPHCGFSKEEKMPTDSCQFFYICQNCKKTLQPKEGDCCVYCSYGDVKCPSQQENNNSGVRCGTISGFDGG